MFISESEHMSNPTTPVLHIKRLATDHIHMCQSDDCGEVATYGMALMTEGMDSLDAEYACAIHFPARLMGAFDAIIETPMPTLFYIQPNAS